MAANLTSMTHKIAIQLHLVAESCTICSSRSRRPVPKLLDTPSYTNYIPAIHHPDSIPTLLSIKLKRKVKLSLCLTKHHAIKTYWGNGGITLWILNLGTRWRSVVSFTPQPLYSQGKSSQEAGWRRRWVIHKFPDWPPGAITASGTALCH
jgi:hypothetical protein